VSHTSLPALEGGLAGEAGESWGDARRRWRRLEHRERPPLPHVPPHPCCA